MSNDDQIPPRLPDPGAPPPGASPRLWLYARTQWRRMFGLNVSQVDDLLFVGGEFTAPLWPALYDLGIRAVLNLQAEREDRFEATPPERTLRLPVQDFHPPTVEQLREAVTFIGAARADGLPVLVHCHAGVGRAALTASAYLMTWGLSQPEAFDRIKRARPIVALTETQLERLLEWEQLLREQPISDLQAPDPLGLRPSLTAL